MPLGREMSSYGAIEAEGSDNVDHDVNDNDNFRKEENIFALFRYVFSWFRRKGKTQPQPNVPLFQQHLKGVQPIMTLTVAAITFAIVGVVLLSIGVLVFRDQAQIFQYSVQYGGKANSGNKPLLGLDPFQYDRTQSCQSGECLISITLPETVMQAKSRVHVYYQLTGFHQNHRKYVSSVCQKQLVDSPQAQTYQQLVACLLEDAVSVRPDSGANFSRNDILWPVGRIAKSFFTDHFELVAGGEMAEDDLVRPLVARWFKNPAHYPSQLDNNTVYLFQEFQSSAYDFYASGLRNPHFMTWMQPQAFPHFRKLFGTIERPKNATLQFRVRSGFDVSSFGGTKGLLVATKSLTGARNPYLVPLLLVIGGGALLLAAAMGVMRMFWNREMAHPMGTAQRPQLQW